MEQGIGGLSFGKPEWKETKDCKYLENYLVKMALLWTLKNEGRKSFTSVIGQCFSFVEPAFLTMAYFPYLDEIGGVKKYLVENKVSGRERFKIQSYFLQTKKVTKNYRKLIELISFGIDSEKFKTPYQRYRYQNEVNELASPFWRNIFSLNIALHSGNQPWLISLIKDLNRFSPYSFLVRGSSFTKQERVMIRDYLLALLEKVDDEFENEEIIKILAEKITRLGVTNNFKTIRSRLDAEWSLSELRANFKNPRLKKEFFDFWYQGLIGRTSDSELDQKLRDGLNAKVLKSASPGQMWVFEHYFPADEELRKIIINKLLAMWKSGDILEAHQVIKVLSDPKISRLLGEANEDFKRANFQLKREFFKELLRSGRGVNYALYSLYRLGDEDLSNLWWIIF